MFLNQHVFDGNANAMFYATTTNITLKLENNRLVIKSFDVKYAVNSSTT